MGWADKAGEASYGGLRHGLFEGNALSCFVLAAIRGEAAWTDRGQRTARRRQVLCCCAARTKGNFISALRLLERDFSSCATLFVGCHVAFSFSLVDTSVSIDRPPSTL